MILARLRAVFLHVGVIARQQFQGIRSMTARFFALFW